MPKILNFVFIAVLVSVSAFAADPSIDLTKYEEKIERKVLDATGAKYDVFIAPRLKAGCAYGCEYEVSASSMKYRSVRVVIRGVTADNLEEKANEIIGIIVAETNRKIAADKETVKMLHNINNVDDSANAIFDNGIGFETGAPNYSVIWFQLPGVRKRNNDTFIEGKTQWMRTSFVIGERKDDNQGSGKITVQANSTLFELQAGGLTDGGLFKAALIRFGTVRLSGRIDQTEADGTAFKSRADFEILGLTMSQGYPLGRALRFYLEETVAIALRFLDENKFDSRVAGKLEAKSGFMIKNTVYVGAKGVWDNDAQGSSFAQFGGEIGFRAKNGVWRLGVDYSTTKDADDIYDPMSVVPEGVSVNGGYFMRF